MRRCIVVIVMLFAGFNTIAEAQDVRLHGQLRPRFEQRDPNFPMAPLGDVTMRTRLGVSAVLPEEIRLRLDIQDVLVWGGDAGTPGHLNTAEIHQAFVDVGALGAGLAARIGRQELSLGNQRLISNNNWSQRGRRFDGVRGTLNEGAIRGDAFAMRIAERGLGTGANAWFHGAHARLGLTAADTLHLYGLYNRGRDMAASTDQFTAGGHTTVRAGGLGFSGEAYVQLGTRLDRDVSAWMASAGVDYSFDAGRMALAGDFYSGDADPADGTAKAFDRLFGTGHGFHGYADLFTTLPAHTGQRGLLDAHLRTQWHLAERTDLELNGHLFRSTATPASASSRFGEEVDVVVRHRLRTPLMLEAGGSFFRTGPAMTEVRGLADDLLFGYLMMTVTF
ncbi:MAG TPA: alginate export family protein [Longimicrobiales bacterium]|nr:alginate export family protein [Longimicrobiales bacterium]